MKPMTPLNYEFFKQKKLVELACILATNYASNWQTLPFAQKYYGFPRQVFVKKFCEVGHSSLLPIYYVDNLKKFWKLYMDGEKNLEDVINVQFLIFIHPNFMIVEDDD